MGLRKQKRQIAKARLTALSVGHVNKAMHTEQDGVKNWRRALIDPAAEKAQLIHGIKTRRKIKKVAT